MDDDKPDFEDRAERQQFHHDEDWRDFCADTDGDAENVSAWREWSESRTREMWEASETSWERLQRWWYDHF